MDAGSIGPDTSAESQFKQACHMLIHIAQSKSILFGSMAQFLL